jgi:hypothetical protein
MFRSGLVAFAALFSVTVTATGWAYEIKPKSPDTAFSGKLKPDIVGLSSATEGSKAAPVFEAYLKDLPGVKPETAQKFGGTNVTYVTAMKFTLAPTSTHPGDRCWRYFLSSKFQPCLLYFAPSRFLVR